MKKNAKVWLHYENGNAVSYEGEDLELALLAMWRAGRWTEISEGEFSVEGIESRFALNPQLFHECFDNGRITLGEMLGIMGTDWILQSQVIGGRVESRK